MLFPASKLGRLLIACPLVVSPAIALADSDTRRVNCARGDGTQAALGKKNPHRPLTVIIRGICTEQVTIQQDDVTLQGEVVESDGILGSLRIDGARRVVVAGLTLSNPAGHGVTITNGASATIQGNHINDSSGYGLFVRNGSFALVNDNMMLRNGIVNQTDPNASGIGVRLGSTVRASRNVIAENASTGIEVVDNSTYRSERDSISAPAGRPALDIFRAGLVELSGVTVNGRVFVNQQSQLEVRNIEGAASTIAGDIDAVHISLLRLRPGVVRTGAVRCSAATFSVCRCESSPGGVCP